MSSARAKDRGLLLAGAVLLLIATAWLTCLLAPPRLDTQPAMQAAQTESVAPSIEAAPTDTLRPAAATETGIEIWHSDEEFGVSQPGMALRRVVQMLQWREVATVPLAPGDEVLVDQGEYQMVWASEAIDSTQFAEPQGHENPAMPPYRSRVFGAMPERVIDSDQPAPQWRRIPAAQIELPDNLAATFRIDEPWLVTAAASAAPEAGDLRLRFEVLEPASDRDATDAVAADDSRPDATAPATGHALTWLARLGALLLLVLGAGLVQLGLRRVLPATSWLARASKAARFTLTLWITLLCLLLAALLARLL